MLSKALQKANTAVQLDNAQNTEGARSAYSEACVLLQQVLLRTAGEEDRKKLEAIVRLLFSLCWSVPASHCAGRKSLLFTDALSCVYL